MITVPLYCTTTTRMAEYRSLSNTAVCRLTVLTKFRSFVRVRGRIALRQMRPIEVAWSVCVLADNGMFDLLQLCKV